LPVDMRLRLIDQAGAKAADPHPLRWRPLGQLIGDAYQLADDLLDAVGSSDEGGKPVTQDTANTRPNAVSEYGVSGVMDRLKQTVHAAVDSIPECEGADELRSLIVAQATRLVPSKLSKSAA
ncbi:MAG: polyprenyl synthetase family protein, partial [Pseudomonadota bacterium]